MGEDFDSLEDIYNLAEDLSEGGYSEISIHYRDLQVIERQYRDEVLIGAGALKEVYRCYDERSKRFIALARPKAGLSEGFYDQFIYEAQLTSALAHPNIIKVYEINLDPDGVPYFTMELKGEASYEDFLAQQPSLEEALESYVRICYAVSYAHQEGIIHLDLKPENIQCDLYSGILVCDWGLAKYIGEKEAQNLAHLEDSEDKTIYGMIKGTPGFMAPEQATPDTIKDERTDIYALGCILYYLLQGQSPYGAEKVEQIIERTREGAYNALELRGERRSQARRLLPIVEKALEKEPEKRYQSVEELLNDLKAYRTLRPTSRELASPWRCFSLYLLRHRIGIAVGTAVLCLLVAGFTISERARIEAEKRSLASERKMLDAQKELNTAIDRHHLYMDYLHTSDRGFALDVFRKSREAIFLSESPNFHREIDEAYEALENLDEEHRNLPNIKGLRAILAMVRMDFDAVIQIGKIEEGNYRGALAIAQQIPKAQRTRANRHMRKNLKYLLRTFIQDGREYEYERRYIYLIFRYAYLSQGSSYNHTSDVLALLDLYNENVDSYKASYNGGRKALNITAARQRVSLRGWERDSSILKYLKLNTLRLEFDYKFELSYLNQLNCKNVDLSKVSKLKFTEPIMIHNLERLIVRRDYDRLGNLKESIKSEKPYEVVLID